MEILLKTYPNESTALPNDDALDQNIGFIITCIEIPLIFFAIYFLIRSTQSIRVVVINLLIADLIQIVCMLLKYIDFEFNVIERNKLLVTLNFIYVHVSITAFYFRMCIAIERDSQIAFPGSNCPVTRLAHTLLSGWLLPFIVILIFSYSGPVYLISFIPHVVVILCFVHACWSYFRSTSPTPMEKSFALAPLFLILFSYIILTLPLQIILIHLTYVEMDTHLNGLDKFTSILYTLNPLVDCLLCVFMRSYAENTRMSHCFSRLKRNRRSCDHV